MVACNYALGEDAVHAFASLSFQQRRELLLAFDHLVRLPGQKGDYAEGGISGRIYEVRLIDDMLVTWWVDHAVREVRIVRLERVD